MDEKRMYAFIKGEYQMHFIRKNDLIHKIGTILIALYFMFYVFDRINDVDLMIPRWIIGMFGYLLLFDFTEEKKKVTEYRMDPRNRKRFYFALTLFLLSFIAVSFNGNASYQGWAYSFHFYGIALMLLTITLQTNIIKWSFYLHVLFFGFHIVTGTNPNALFYVSRNYVSIILLVQVLLVYITTFKNRLPVSYTPAILYVVFCVWAVGRSGVIVSLIVLAGVILHKTDWMKIQRVNAKKLITRGVLVGSIFLVVFFIAMNVIPAFAERVEYYLSSGLTSSARSRIMHEYLYRMGRNPFTFLFGVSIEGNRIFALWGGNLHNSFLRAHHNYGLIGLLLLLTGLGNASFVFLKREQVLYSFLILGICTRIFTDTAAFFGIMDPFILYFIVEGWERRTDVLKGNTDAMKDRTDVRKGRDTIAP